MKKIHFGTDGWRAVISDEFTFANVEIISQAMADYIGGIKSKIRNKKSELYKKQYAVCIGYDTRFLSEKYAEIVATVLSANGIKVFLSDRSTPTPSVSFYIRKHNLIGGVMITASHNPFNYNGVKYKGYFGGSVGTEITGKMEKGLYKSKVKKISIDEARKRKLFDYKDLTKEHIESVKRFIDLKSLKNIKLKVLVDSMNGTGKDFLEQILSNTKMKIDMIYAKRDAYFGGRSPEPNEHYLSCTAKKVKKGKYDLGLATDGDADRLGVISSDGKVLTGHKVMTLLFLHLLEDRKKRGGVVQTICGTKLIDKICAEYGLETFETSVGFKYIAQIFLQENILVGGEETGGVAFKGWLPERDGIVSALMILEMIAYRKKSLKKILEHIDKKYGTYVYKRCDLEFSEKKKKKLMGILKNKPFKSINGKKVVNVKSFDGFKYILQDDSWVMFRASGTEPKLRIYSEASSGKKAQSLVDCGKRFANRV